MRRGFFFCGCRGEWEKASMPDKTLAAEVQGAEIGFGARSLPLHGNTRARTHTCVCVTHTRVCAFVVALCIPVVIIIVFLFTCLLVGSCGSL